MSSDPQDTKAQPPVSETDAEMVGYKNPPKKHRFRKGQSGNPKGRPKGRLNFPTVIDRQLRTLVTLREGDKLKTVSKLEALVASLIAHGSKGKPANVNALARLLQMADFFQPQVKPAADPASDPRTRVEVTFLRAGEPKAGQLIETDGAGNAFTNKAGEWETTIPLHRKQQQTKT